jgi:DNA-binding response OmpR family regulator
VSDKLIIELMLAEISSEEVCSVLRKNSEVHNFMTTTKGSLNDIIARLNLYLVVVKLCKA